MADELLLPIRHETEVQLGHLRILGPGLAPGAPAPGRGVTFALACLRERCRYEIELVPRPDLEGKMRLAPHPLVRALRIDPDRLGVVETGDNVGLVELLVEVVGLRSSARLLLEVRSSKLDHDTKYRHMLNHIADKATELLMAVSAPSAVRVTEDWGASPLTLGQRFEFLRAVLESPEFDEAIAAILARPHSRLVPTIEWVDASKGLKHSSAIARALRGSGRRVPLNPDSRVGRALRERLGINSLPEEVPSTNAEDSLDTGENRFVRHALQDFVRVLRQVNCLAVAREYATVGTQCRALLNRLNSVLDAPMFQELSEAKSIDLRSSVLRQRRGYRELTQIWLRFGCAGRVVWDPDETTFRPGLRNSNGLYEYWVFFQLLGVLESICEVDRTQLSKILILDPDGLTLGLRRGRDASVFAAYRKGQRPLGLRFTYNRTFSSNAQEPAARSWTLSMRPDVTVSIWPEALGEAGAQVAGEVVHLHFDAKYAFEDIFRLEGDADEDAKAERALNSRAKSSDLGKMHAYRDAILNSEGAFVVFPGGRLDRMEKYPGSMRLLPGLGAFPLRPDSPGLGTGVGEIAKFMEEVLGLVSNPDTAVMRLRESLRHLLH